MMSRVVITLFLLWMGQFMLPSCGSNATPLDSDARHRVDSLSAAGIGVARREIDSLYKLERIRTLPHLVDSIRKVREREIGEQLRSIPKN
jgi:hypothetical protein